MSKPTEQHRVDASPTNCVIIAYLGRRGGGSLYSLHLASAIEQEGANVCTLVSARNEDILLFRSKLKALESIAVAHTKIELVTKFWGLFQFIFVVLRKLKGEKVAPVVHFTMFHPWAAPLILLCRSVGMQVVFTVHDYTPHSGDGGRLMSLLIKLCVRFSHKVVTLNEPVADEVIRRHQFIKGDTLIVQKLLPFFEIAEQEPSDQNIESYGQKMSITFCGRISPYKGVSTFLQACMEYRNYDPSAIFTLAGDGPLDEYADQITNLGESLRVINKWLDHSELMGLLKQASVCVLPYTDSTQSGVMPLALAAGTPVVITPSEGLVSQMPYGSGIVARDHSPVAVADALTELLCDEHRYHEFSKVARSSQQGESWRDQARQLLRIYINA